MKDRIRQIMESQHMSQQVFAEFIGTTPATLSGIFNDRTRPTINIVESIKKKIPDINTDWLLFGKGEMYQQAAELPAGSDPSSRALPGGGQVMESMIDFGLPDSSTPQASSRPTPLSAASRSGYYNGVRPTPSALPREDLKILDKPKRHVTEIRVYYDDQTWESFVPSKKS